MPNKLTIEAAMAKFREPRPREVIEDPTEVVSRKPPAYVNEHRALKPGTPNAAMFSDETIAEAARLRPQKGCCG